MKFELCLRGWFAKSRRGPIETTKERDRFLLFESWPLAPRLNRRKTASPIRSVLALHSLKLVPAIFAHARRGEPSDRSLSQFGSATRSVGQFQCGIPDPVGCWPASATSQESES